MKMAARGFTSFFDAAAANEANTDGNGPYDYQRRLAGGDKGTACSSQLISIPTGLGKAPLSSSQTPYQPR